MADTKNTNDEVQKANQALKESAEGTQTGQEAKNSKTAQVGIALLSFIAVILLLKK